MFYLKNNNKLGWNGWGGKKSSLRFKSILFCGMASIYLATVFDTLHVLKRVARRLCRSVQPPSLQIKTCAGKNRSSGRQASPTHSSILPIPASPSACLSAVSCSKARWQRCWSGDNHLFFLLSVFFHMTEYVAPGATWHDEGDKWLLPEGTTFFKLLHQFSLFFLIIILHNTHLPVSRRFCSTAMLKESHLVTMSTKTMNKTYTRVALGLY